MKLETFFEKFDQFADAPDAVAKMRELVLELAVQGRLVPQHATEETAHVLLERVASTAKTRGRDAGESEDTDAPFHIPETWAWVRLPRVLKKLTDGTHHSPPNGQSGAFMYVTAKNIKTDGVLLDGITYVSKDVHDEIYSRCDPSFGDILYIKDGATTGIATINQVKEPFSMLSSVALLKPSEAIFNRYLLWAMRSPFFYAETRGAMKGAAITRVTLSVMAASLLPLPPLAEQKRIVAKVDELMALCDRLEAQQQERETRHAALARASLARFDDAPTPANLSYLFHSSFIIHPSDLRKSILTLAVQGKLVPQDPNDEPAEETLRRCKVDLKRWAVAPDEERQAVPDSWTWIRFAGVGEQRLGKMLDAQKNRGELKPYLRNTNVQWMRFELDDVKDMRVEEREVEELQLKTGDLLICEGGEPGRCAIWRDKVSEMYFQKALHRVRPCDGATSEYLALNLQIDCANGVLAGYFTGATIKHLTGRSLAAYPIPIPPLAEQRRIVAKVEQLMALVDALETQLAASRATVANLLSALVAELTGAAGTGKVSVLPASSSGRRGRPRNR